LAKADRYGLLLLGDLSYAKRDPGRNVVTLRAHLRALREQDHRITANAPFSEWGQVFPNKAVTVAAIDHLIHHATIMEMNVGSYRRHAAYPARRQRSEPAD
jgi:DNA replication protein DnaC